MVHAARLPPSPCGGLATQRLAIGDQGAAPRRRLLDQRTSQRRYFSAGCYAVRTGPLLLAAARHRLGVPADAVLAAFQSCLQRTSRARSTAGRRGRGFDLAAAPGSSGWSADVGRPRWRWFRIRGWPVAAGPAGNTGGGTAGSFDGSAAHICTGSQPPPAARGLGLASWMVELSTVYDLLDRSSRPGVVPPASEPLRGASRQPSNRSPAVGRTAAWRRVFGYARWCRYIEGAEAPLFQAALFFQPPAAWRCRRWAGPAGTGRFLLRQGQ